MADHPVGGDLTRHHEPRDDAEEGQDGTVCELAGAGAQLLQAPHQEEGVA